MRRALTLAIASAAIASGLACGGGSSGSTDQVPPTPENLNAVAGYARQVMVSWSPVFSPRLDHYVIYWRKGSDAPAMLTNVTPPDAGRVIPRLKPGDYFFAVEAVDRSGRASPRSAEVGVTVLWSAQTAVPLGTDGTPNGYYEYLPPGYGDGVARPLLVSLHGLGAAGDGIWDVDWVLMTGPAFLIYEDAWPATRPFVVLSPQVDGCWNGEVVHAFLSWALANYTVDPKQVFLTGLSCGAFGIWDYLGTYTDTQVAAAVLMCGNPGSAWTRAGCDLGKVALWAFHGTDDTVAPIYPEWAVMQSLLGCPSPPRRDVVFTPVPGAGHDVWTDAYAGTTAGDVFAWLLAHPKP